MQNIGIYLTAIAGGSFIYIALVDLMPELHNTKHENKKTLSLEFLFIILGITIMLGVKFLGINFK
jgi:zinc transporter ZupT